MPSIEQEYQHQEQEIIEPEGRIKNIFWDKDGTLLNSMRRFADVFATAMWLYGNYPEEEAKKLFLGTIGTPTHEQIRMLEDQFASKESHLSFSPEFRMTLGKYIDKNLPYVEPFEEVPGVLKKLHKMGYTMLISSSHPAH